MDTADKICYRDFDGSCLVLLKVRESKKIKRIQLNIYIIASAKVLNADLEVGKLREELALTGTKNGLLQHC